MTSRLIHDNIRYWLNEFARAKDWNQSECVQWLAKELNVSDRSVYGWMDGRQRPSRQRIPKIAACLGISPEHLTGEFDRKTIFPTLINLNNLLHDNRLPEQAKAQLVRQLEATLQLAKLIQN